MFQLLCFYLAALSYLQGSTQMSINSAHSRGNTDLSTNAGKNTSGLYISRWKKKFSSHEFLEKAKLDTKAGKSETGGQKLFPIEGTFAVPRPVPYGYEYFPGLGYYKFYPSASKSYEGAILICRNDSAYLAILNSEAEAEVLKSIFARHPYAFQYAYLGFNDQNEEGNFVTIFGDPLRETGYERWLYGEPNPSYADEDCGTIHRSGGLNDYPCERSFEVPFFCEYDPFLENNESPSDILGRKTLNFTL